MKPGNSKTCLVFETVVDAGKVYSYQTGSFYVTYIKGVKYLLILYYYDTNAILSDPLKSRNGKDVLHDCTTYHEYLKEMVFRPKIHWL